MLASSHYFRPELLSLQSASAPLRRSMQAVKLRPRPYSRPFEEQPLRPLELTATLWIALPF